MDRGYYASLREKRKIIGFNLKSLSSGPLKGRFLALRTMQKRNARIVSACFYWCIIPTPLGRLHWSSQLSEISENASSCVLRTCFQRTNTGSFNQDFAFMLCRQASDLMETFRPALFSYLLSDSFLTPFFTSS